MKPALLAIMATLIVGPILTPGTAAAKSVKWSCVNVDPSNPSTYLCTPVMRP